MDSYFKSLLACPLCVGELTFVGNDAGNGDGTLSCNRCSESYPVVRGIPRLLPPQVGAAEATSRRFAEEFTAFAADDRDLDPLELREYLFFSRSGIDRSVYEQVKGDYYPTSLEPHAYRPDTSFLHGKTVLDAGCGPGRFTEIAARADTRLTVGLELGSHVERAAARCRDLPNAFFVQGSVLQPPFRPDSFDYAFSIGVIHHTSDPREALIRIGSCVRADGAMSVWVYPPEYWGSPVRKFMNKLVHRLLVRVSDKTALAIVTKALYPLGRLQMRLARRRWTKLLGAPLFVVGVPRHPSREVMIATIFDYFASRQISTHTYDELTNWFQEAGFVRSDRLPVPTSVLAWRSE